MGYLKQTRAENERCGVAWVGVFPPLLTLVSGPVPFFFGGMGQGYHLILQAQAGGGR